MNVRKMRQIGKDILREPHRFNMNHWAALVEDEEQAKNIGHAVVPPCGTVLCFAGQWAARYVKLTPFQVWEKLWTIQPGKHVSVAARDDLQLPNERLFHSGHWPMMLQTGLQPGTREYAEHFVNVVLEDYIATGGWAETIDKEVP